MDREASVWLVKKGKGETQGGPPYRIPRSKAIEVLSQFPFQYFAKAPEFGPASWADAYFDPEFAVIELLEPSDDGKFNVGYYYTLEFSIEKAMELFKGHERDPQDPNNWPTH